ncbi:protein suppressor of hairy wing [Sitodiplosis mosellana]|uniref:protein suppressor of hairy wing n=1 Tax=Sitodiplosis mosellana TaxID=263140 RepID=UPI002443B706|nr:protein suppressor of hairy wing [Sitodiplosis mosellana]
MDDFNHMMEYQSQMMTSVNRTDECVETQQHEEFVESCTPQEVAEPSSKKTTADESQTNVDGQSVSDNADEISTPAKDDAHESAQLDDRCAVDSNECENKTNVSVASDELKTQVEIPPETEKMPETDGDGVGESGDNGGDDGDNDGNDVERDDKINDQIESNEQNATEAEAKTKKPDEIELNQCRICMSPENLLDIFRIGEKTSFRICDLIMKLAPSVKINERDYLPHSVCGNCVDRVEAAYELRVQCEETDKVLRSKLKRSKKTRRAPSEFVLLDCVESSSDSDDDQKSDDEFQLSEESEESSESDSESSYDEKKKRLPSLRGRRRGPPPQTLKRPIPTTVTHQPQPLKKSRNNSVVYIKAVKSDDDDDGGGGGATKKGQPVKPIKSPIATRLQFRCDVCNRPCGTAQALAQHRRTHVDEKCTICAMVFKQRSALMQHMQRHREDPERICKKCHRVFTSKIECQRHVQVSHPETAVCQKCKRYFPNKSQLDAHKCNSIVTAATNNDRKPIETTSKRKNDTDTTTVSGRDLFKSVAPLTTTYWSDSFSD